MTTPGMRPEFPRPLHGIRTECARSVLVPTRTRAIADRIGSALGPTLS